MAKTRIIAETGAGQHGVAVATVAARFGLPCVIYMGATDIERQRPNVFRMKLLGAEVKPVTSGNGTLKDAMNDALRDWVANVENTFYIIGTVAGPHPYPAMVRDFQSIIGRGMCVSRCCAREGRLPAYAGRLHRWRLERHGPVHDFLADRQDADLWRGGRGGHGLEVPNGHAASMNGGRTGRSPLKSHISSQNEDGQISKAHSFRLASTIRGRSGTCWLRDTGRVTTFPRPPEGSSDAFQLCTKLGGIIPAVEPAHALALCDETGADL